MMELGFTKLFMGISALICILGPVLIAALMVKKYKASRRAFLGGAIVFIVSQPLLRIPILNQLKDTTWFTLFTLSHTVVYIILLALSAGIFEETGRYFGLRFFLKNKLSWENGIVFGLGHGGAEAFSFVGLNYLKTIFALLTGQTVDWVANTPSYLFLVGGVERILAITAHIGMTMLVLYAVKYGKKSYFLLAVLFHTLIDITSPIIKQVGIPLNVWGSEGCLAVFALLAFLITFKFKAVLARV
ncbi:MAG TPA: YhfC family glutamic-type intramembrane protease [Desulfitobacteriaceae bacterium]|jgi:uncharacterized membrane protein YhfC|nr:YhfC family glutamic-type intramembrane protease [Desulfitobacteriaceae bacterium]